MISGSHIIPTLFNEHYNEIYYLPVNRSSSFCSPAIARKQLQINQNLKNP